jgi:hypothetical protein
MGFQDSDGYVDFLTYDAAWEWQGPQKTLLYNDTGISPNMHIVVVINDAGSIRMYINGVYSGTTKSWPQQLRPGISNMTVVMVTA